MKQFLFIAIFLVLLSSCCFSETYTCDNMPTPEITFSHPIPDFSTPVGCSGTGCTIQAILINSGVTISNFGFALHNGSGGSRNAAIKVEVWNFIQTTLIDEKTNDVGGTFAGDISLSIDATTGYMENMVYVIKVYYKPCPTIDASSIDEAYNIYYNYSPPPADWVPIGTKKIRPLPATSQITCSAFPQDYAVDFTQGVNTFAYDIDPDSNPATEDGSYVTTKGNEMKFAGFEHYIATCVNGESTPAKPMLKAELYEADTSALIDTFDNNPDGTLTLEEEVLVPLDNYGKYYVELYIKECPLEPMEVASWNDFLNQYINVVDDWVRFTGKPNMINDAIHGWIYQIIVLNPSDMGIVINVPDQTFYFPPQDQTYTWTIPWDLTNNSDSSPGHTGEWFKIKPISAVLGEPAPVITGSAEIIAAPTLDVPGSPQDTATLTETFKTPLQETLKAIEMLITLEYDDTWGLTTIPPKQVSAKVQVSFVPPPADVLVVEQINISPSKNLPKETTTCCDVEVVLKNYSKAILEPEVQLNFWEATTNKKMTSTEYTQQTTMVYSETGNNEQTVTFSCVPIKNNSELEAGKNYWVKANITNPGIEKTLINDEKREMLSIIAAPSVAVPETNLLLLALIPIAVLIVLWKRKQ